MKHLMVIVLAVLAICAPARASESPQLHDFARMMPLELAGAGALHELPLPKEVYVWTSQRGLGDLALFNGKGEIVPFTLVTPSPAKTASAGKDLPLFPLAAAMRRQQGAIAVMARTDEQGAIVTLNTATGKALCRPITGYIVDASALDQRVTGFDIGLTPGEKGYIGTMRVETSDDLQLWRQHATGAIATLSVKDRQLNKNRIEFPAVKARYFRLSIGPELGAPRLDSVTARLESTLSTRQREKATYVITAIKGRSGEYLARTDGQMPVDRLRLVFPDENSLAGVTFYSRPDNKSPWIERGCGTFYRLRRDATVVENSPLEIAPTADRQWLIRVRQPGGGLGSRLPLLEVGWQPHHLIFAARGEPPFRLAYGSAFTELDTLRDDGIAAGLATWEKQQIMPLPAKAGASVESGGAQALKPHVPAATWRKALLWGVLLLGVLLLARMAWQLGREMGAGGSR
ncbi:MAG: DUF3999 family protein [Geobacter sp.]|nr:DUF3999 family protein [Geobacter sp.]